MIGVMTLDTLQRYALAYIKKSGNNSNVEEFLRFYKTQYATTYNRWSEENFNKVYGGFTPTNGDNTRNRNDQHGDRDNRQPTGPQIHVHNNRGLDLWDYFLLRSLFSGNTTVINNLGSGSSSQPSRGDKKKDSEDNRKLLALGIVVAVVCIAFHALMCVWYNSSRKAARKSEEVGYLDNQLKMFRNIEFAVGAISLAALIGCAVNPVLPAWGLVILGINSLVCFAGGLAFHMKHEKESENIKKAKEAVDNCRQQGPGHSSGDSSHREPPPPYFPQDPNAAPTAPFYDDIRPGRVFSHSNAEQHSGDQDILYEH